jgi:hypothetical protein
MVDWGYDPSRSHRLFGRTWGVVMKKLVAETSALIKEYGWNNLLSAFLGGFVFSTLAIFPLYIIFVEILLLFSYLKELWFALLFATAIGHIALINVMAIKALLIKIPVPLSNPKKLLQIHAAIEMGIVLLIGVIVIVFIIPMLWI